MKLLTKELEKKFEKYPYRSQEGKEGDAEVLVKYFNPAGAGTWLITEAEKQENGDWMLFGYCHILEWEWGPVMLSELESIKGPFGIGIERDLYCQSQKYIKDFPETDYYEKKDQVSNYFRQKPNVTIGDYSVGDVSWFKDHEGMDIFNCYILYNGKQIGFFSESYMNGPDEYTFVGNFEKELKKLRKTAEQFFEKSSNEDEICRNEDFFIRLLRNIKEASMEIKNPKQKVEISTSYPYEYKITDNESDIAPSLKDEDNKKFLVIPCSDLTMNIDVEMDKEEEHELI